MGEQSFSIPLFSILNGQLGALPKNIVKSKKRNLSKIANQILSFLYYNKEGNLYGS